VRIWDFGVYVERRLVDCSVHQSSIYRRAIYEGDVSGVDVIFDLVVVVLAEAYRARGRNDA
jgi:hypothetical protein